MANTKIATCCYCGTKAALVLKGETRHELACSSCGAPLHEMKMLKEQPAPNTYTVPKKKQKVESRRRKSKKPKRGKTFKKFLFDEVWDTIEDIFD